MPLFQLSARETPRAEKGTDTEELQRRKQKEMHEKGSRERVSLSPTSTGRERECRPIPPAPWDLEIFRCPLPELLGALDRVPSALVLCLEGQGAPQWCSTFIPWSPVGLWARPSLCPPEQHLLYLRSSLRVCKKILFPSQHFTASEN